MATAVVPATTMMVMMEMRELMEMMEMMEVNRPNEHGRAAIGPPWAEGGFVKGGR